MITVRRAQERGHVNFGWLDTWHTFSFGQYFDPAHLSFGDLRVINQDWVAPGQGFGTHPHRDMEIVTYVCEGALAHRDSLGNGSTMVPGDVQRMTAGTGVTHSEFNASETEAVRFLQIWLLPEATGLTPGYEQKRFAPADKQGRLRLIASRDGRDGSVVVHQDAAIYAGLLAGGDRVEHRLATGRRAWVQVVQGALMLDGTALNAGDGAAVSDESRVSLTAVADSEVLLFDLR